MQYFKEFPELKSKDIRCFKIVILIMIFLAIVICVYDNRYNAVAEGEHYEDKLPIYSVETNEKVVSITFDAAWGNIILC